MGKIASIAALGFTLISAAACKQETTNSTPEATATEVVAVPVPGPTVTETVAAKPTPTP